MDRPKDYNTINGFRHHSIILLVVSSFSLVISTHTHTQTHTLTHTHTHTDCTQHYPIHIGNKTSKNSLVIYLNNNNTKTKTTGDHIINEQHQINVSYRRPNNLQY